VFSDCDQRREGLFLLVYWFDDIRSMGISRGLFAAVVVMSESAVAVRDDDRDAKPATKPLCSATIATTIEIPFIL
jgi:hypothetical protein